MIAVAGEIVKRTVDAAKETGFDQLKFDLFQRSFMELLGDLDFEALLGGNFNDLVRLAQFVGNRRLQQHMQAMLDRHDAHLAIGTIIHGNDADHRRSFLD